MSGAIQFALGVIVGIVATIFTFKVAIDKTIEKYCSEEAMVRDLQRKYKARMVDPGAGMSPFPSETEKVVADAYEGTTIVPKTADEEWVDDPVTFPEF